MATKKTEKKPFPEELKKRTAAKKAVKTKEVETKDTQVEPEEVATEEETVATSATDTGQLHQPEEQGKGAEEKVLSEENEEVITEEEIDEAEFSEEFTVEGGDVETDETQEGVEHGQEGSDEPLPEAGVEYDRTDPEQGPQEPVIPKMEDSGDKLTEEDKEDLNKAIEEIKPVVEQLVNGENPEGEKPELPKQRNYYNDRFASTWGGVQYDY